MAARNPYGQRNDGGACTCSECGRTFGGLRGFDRHRVNATGADGYDPDYDWRCATDAELRAAGYEPTGPLGVWKDHGRGRSPRAGGTRTAPAVASRGMGR